MTGVSTEQVTAEEAGLRLDRWFKRRYPDLPHGRLQKLARSGQIRVDGKRAKPADRLEAGQQVRVPPLGPAPAAAAGPARPKPPPALSDADRALIQSAVIYEDDAAIALNKPPGLASQGGSKTTKHVDGLMAALADGRERPRLVHRLDRDTSGVLLLAKSASAAAALTAAFRDRSARKVYWALVVGVPKPERGTIDLALRKAGGRGAERMTWEGLGKDEGERAVTDFAVLERAGRFAALVAMRPLTGRTHQLRAHMAAIGHPILGDGKYGGAEATLPGMALPRGMMLHARSLDLPHPSGAGRLFIEAEPPPAFAAALDAFGFDPASLPDPFLEAGR